MYNILPIPHLKFKSTYFCSYLHSFCILMCIQNTLALGAIIFKIIDESQTFGM